MSILLNVYYIGTSYGNNYIFVKINHIRYKMFSDEPNIENVQRPSGFFGKLGIDMSKDQHLVDMPQQDM